MQKAGEYYQSPSLDTSTTASSMQVNPARPESLPRGSEWSLKTIRDSAKQIKQQAQAGEIRDLADEILREAESMLTRIQVRTGSK